jgi:hypothetical protein
LNDLDYNKAIYGYIYSLWETSGLSIRGFAAIHTFEERSMRDIIKAVKEDKDYQISLPTLYKICESLNISLSQFFIEVEKWQNSN